MCKSKTMKLDEKACNYISFSDFAGDDIFLSVCRTFVILTYYIYIKEKTGTQSVK